MSSKLVSIRARARRALVPAYLAFGIACSVALAPPVAVAQDLAIANTLSLETAIARAIENDVGLRAADAGVAAARGGVKQARTWLNPELSAEVENFNGKDDLRGFDGAESTYSLSQEIEIGGQRSARIRLADRELHGAELDRALRGLDLIRDVQIAYYDALAADELVKVARERLKTAQALTASVDRRVKAARDPLMAGARAEAGLAEAQVDVTRAEAAAETARAKLASLIGAHDGVSPVPAAFALPRAKDHDHSNLSDASPDLARLAAERDRSGAAVKVERSLAWQNPTLSVGYRRFEDRGGDGAMVAGFSIPLGVFNRNQGGVARARAQQQRAELDLEAGRRVLLREGAALERSIAADAAAVRAMEDTVIPRAERALSLAQDGYNRGAFSYLDVLEAQRALSDAREARVESLKSYHTNEAALDRLTARFGDALSFEELHQ